MRLSKWKPRNSLEHLHDEFDRMVDRVFGQGDPEFLSGDLFAPPVDVVEKGDQIRVRMEIPGLDAEDLDVQVEGDRLIISGEKKEEEKDEKDNTWRYECRYGSFRRVIPLPARVDSGGVKAKFRRGVLRLKLPKTKASETQKVVVHNGD